MPKMDIAEALAQMPALIEVAMNGEEVVITQNNQPIVKLVPIPSPKKHRPPLFGIDKGLIAISDNFDEAIEDFKDYM